MTFTITDVKIDYVDVSTMLALDPDTLGLMDKYAKRTKAALKGDAVRHLMEAMSALTSDEAHGKQLYYAAPQGSHPRPFTLRDVFTQSTAGPDRFNGFRLPIHIRKEDALRLHTVRDALVERGAIAPGTDMSETFSWCLRAVSAMLAEMDKSGTICAVSDPANGTRPRLLPDGTTPSDPLAGPLTREKKPVITIS